MLTFADRHLNRSDAPVTIILGVCSLAAVICDACLVDIIGRRRMTLVGFTGACFGVTLMAIIGCLHYESPSLGKVLVSSLPVSMTKETREPTRGVQSQVFAGVAANFFNTFQSSTSYAYLTEMPEQRFKARAT